MVIGMVDEEPPYFNNRPLEAMCFIQGLNPPRLKHPEKVAMWRVCELCVYVCGWRCGVFECGDVEGVTACYGCLKNKEGQVDNIH